LTFAFAQPLLRGAGARVDTASLQIARLAEAANVLALRQTTASIVSDVIVRYRSYIQAERRVGIRVKSLERARAQLAVNETLVETGRMAARDIVQTQADIAGRELDLTAAENGLDAARLTLADILDVDSRTRFRLADSLLAGEAETDAGRAVETALANRPDYRTALLNLRAAEIAALVAEDGRQWDLSLNLGAETIGGDNFLGRAGRGLGKVDYNVALRLEIPVGPAAVDPAEREHLRARTALTKARNALTDNRQRIDIEVSGALREVALAVRQIDLARTARMLAEQQIDVEREKLRLGLSSSFRLVAAEADLVAAENRELDAVIAHLNALTALDLTLGVTLERWDIEVEAAGPGAAPSSAGWRALPRERSP